MDQQSVPSDFLSGISTPTSTPSTPAAHTVPVGPIATTSAAKPSPSMWFTSEIQQMMHGFGDCRKPLADSALLIEQIVHQQLVIALYKAEEVAKQRNARFIGIEDFLFLLRKDKIKLRRLIKYMGFKDVKKMMYRCVDDEAEIIEGDTRPQPKKRRKICYDFLSNIDQTGELMSIFEEDNFFDEIKHERALRAELMSREMDAQQYLDFCTARHVSFVARYKSQKFKDWLLQGITLDVKPNPLAVETLSYLAYETVAQVMDLSLIVKRDINAQPGDPLSKTIPQVMMNYDSFQGSRNQMLPPLTTTPLGSSTSSVSAALKSPSSMPSSPLNSPPSTPTTPSQNQNTTCSTLNVSAGSKTKASKKKKKPGASGSKELHSNQAITVAHIREAMRRYGQHVGPFADFYKYSMVPPKQQLLCV